MRWYEDHVTTDPNMSKLNIQTLDFQIAPPEISTDHRARRKKEGTPSQQGSHGSQSMTPRDEKCTDHSCFIYKYIRYHAPTACEHCTCGCVCVVAKTCQNTICASTCASESLSVPRTHRPQRASHHLRRHGRGARQTC